MDGHVGNLLVSQPIESGAMFTGIVEEMGVLEGRQGDRFTFRGRDVVEDIHIGDSIAVNGCCLTVVTHEAEMWSVNISAETRTRTTLDQLAVGQAVNLERPLRLQDRLGGHLVQGHVDATGEVVEPGADLRVAIPSALMRYVVEKGSITVDGVSLTVVGVLEDGFSVALIAHTMQETTLGRLAMGDRVNLEVDVMAKYAERLMTFAIEHAGSAQTVPRC